MMKLFPTETEIKTALGGDFKSLIGPRAEVPKADTSPPANDGLSEECYDAAYGGFASAGASAPTRMFVMQAGYTSPTFVWVLSQRSSDDDIQKVQDTYKERLGKCDRYEFFDSGTGSGTSVAIKPSTDTWPEEGVNVAVTSGDVSMAFAIHGMSHEKAKDVAKKMAPVMEKRLKSSAPKS